MASGIFESCRVVKGELVFALDKGLFCINMDQISSWKIEIEGSNSDDLLPTLQSYRRDILAALVKPEGMPELIGVAQFLLRSDDIAKLLPESVRSRLIRQ